METVDRQAVDELFDEVCEAEHAFIKTAEEFLRGKATPLDLAEAHEVFFVALDAFVEAGEALDRIEPPEATPTTNEPPAALAAPADDSNAANAALDRLIESGQRFADAAEDYLYGQAALVDFVATYHAFAETRAAWIEAEDRADAEKSGPAE